MFVTIYILGFICLIVCLYFSIKRSKSAEFGSPYLPLETKVVERIMKMVDIKKGDVFYDLGSGDGRVVIAAALRGVKAYGVEISFFRTWLSRWKIFCRGLGGRAKIIRANIFEVDLSEASIVHAYLSERTNNMLGEKLEKELKNGTRVVGAAFKFSNWTPVEINLDGPAFGPIYLYKVVKTKMKKI